jgi:hypothetical protein
MNARIIWGIIAPDGHILTDMYSDRHEAMILASGITLNDSRYGELRPYRVREFTLYDRGGKAG